MKKYIIYVESSHYRLTIESESSYQIDGNSYLIKGAYIAKCYSGNNNSNINEKDRFEYINFPIDSTIISQKIFEY